MLPDCPPNHVLSDFVSGSLSAPDSTAISEHLKGCARCAERVREFECAPPTPVIPGDLFRQPTAPPSDPEYRAAVEKLLTDPPFGPPLPGVGETLDEYELLEVLGEGGMGVVYRAVHRRLDKEVAVKLIRRARALDRQVAERFEREMKALGKVRHENLVLATDARVVDGIPFLVMEYVRGTDLAHLVLRDGPLPPERACELIRQAALGLHHAHENGLVHRDVKPSNLILGADGVVRVLDLGLALLPGEPVPVEAPAAPEPSTAVTAAADDTLTEPGQRLGTRNYTAPEQLRDSHRVGPPADVYGLGCTLVFLLTGHAYTPGEPLPPALPAELWAKFLAPDPDHRFASACAAAEALAPLCGAAPRRPRARVVPALGLVALVAAAVALALSPRDRGPKTDSEPHGAPPGAAQAPLEAAPPPRAVPPRGELPMTPDETRARQKHWADHIGQPVKVKNSLGMELVLIPPAEFSMESGYSVTLTRPFRIGTTEVTYGQYRAFLDARPGYKTTAELKPQSGRLIWFASGEGPAKTKPPYHLRNPGWGTYADDQPVAYLTWPDAEAFLEWLSAREGRRYRLPTHAEWSWACRAGSGARYYWGHDMRELDKYAWSRFANRPFPQPVGKLVPNAWGLYDTLGNVAEMVRDYHIVPLPAGHATDPTGPETGTARIACGGDYSASAGFSLNTIPASAVAPGASLSTLGFRVVLEP